jgi:purine-binding chemotaxis protein CheW
MSEVIDTSSDGDNLYLTVQVGGQPFGIPVHCVHDVSKAQKITQVPLAPPEVAGALNLRGRIVTVINVGKKLGLKDTDKDASTVYMYVVIEHEGELYSLMVDSVGDVMSPSPQSFEQNPANMEQGWRDVSAGVYRLDGELLVLLDIQRFFGGGSSAIIAA